VFDRPPNGLGMSRAAMEIGTTVGTKSDFKMAMILGPRSGVGWNHPSDTPYVGTAETALTSASSATILPRQS